MMLSQERTPSRMSEEQRVQPLLPRLSKDNAQKLCLQRIRKGEDVAIDYTKLLQLCRPQEKERAVSVDHDQFMRNYLQLFKPPTRSKTRRGRSVSAHHTTTSDGTLLQSLTEDKLSQRAAGKTAKDCDKGLTSILRTISSIALVYPPFRSRAEVKRLAKLLYFFPDVLPAGCTAAVREGVASRAFLESFKDRHSYALPNVGGVYLILVGSVLMIDKDTDTDCVTSKLLPPGKHFGLLQDHSHPPRHSYPIFWTKEKCVLLRITTTDYRKAVENHKEAEFKERLDLLNSSPVLRTLPPDVKQKLAKAIEWHTYPPGTELLREGRPVTKVSLIHRGKCSVHKKIPTPTDHTHGTQVCIKELGVGSCVGELAIEGTREAPYTITTSSIVRVGHVSITDLAVLEVANNLSPAKKYSITIPSQEELRSIHASKLMSDQWTSLKKSILTTVYKEAGRETVQQ